MDEAAISYELVDIEEHPQHGARIEAKTGGFRTVPTLEVGGELFVNPSIVQVREALAS
jgi:mycoredoxin